MRLALTFLATLAVSCSEQPDRQAPDFPPGSGQPSALPDYPAGPFGLAVGSTMRNLDFYGYATPDSHGAALQPLALADFYNPTGDGVFPEGSPYGAGRAKPKAILIDLCAMWCAPCQEEAATLLPARRAMYAPLGEVFLAVGDSPSPSTPAEQRHLDAWVERYDVAYPAVLDPRNTLLAYFDQQAFPAQLIVRTRDMKIVHAKLGVVDDELWQVFEAVLADQPVLPGD